ncbi:hypothetical protein HCR18_06530 [Wolbachia pipientis]|nr:hypothetical protein [Wolbachia pipientis]MBA8758640.1 hypothetical protein [Wolbachia pipientis]MBA8770080.1 hypothetical protein [Wolbachia pipientis]
MLDTGISFHSIIAVLLSCHPSSLFFVIPVRDNGIQPFHNHQNIVL